MTFDASVAGRLREERERLKLSQAAMAEAVGVRREMWVRYESGTEPGAGVLIRAVQAGLDVLFVLTGRRSYKPKAGQLLPPPMLAESPPKWQTLAQSSLPAAPLMGGYPVTVGDGLLMSAASGQRLPLRLPVVFDGGQVTREFQVIPKYRAAASAGTTDQQQGTAAAGVDAAGVLAMDRAFMRDQLGSDKPGFVSVTVKGDSMERTLIDGETIIIDSDVNEVDCNGVYVVQVGKALLVKRLILGMDGSVLVKSDNPAYSQYDREFSADQAQAIQVVGRMVWPKFR